MLEYAATLDEFLAAWQWLDGNSLRVRYVGERPHVTTWIDDVKIAEIDLATLTAPNHRTSVRTDAALTLSKSRIGCY